MKLATYNPNVQLNNINGEVRTYDTGQAGAMQARALQGLASVAARFAEERQTTDVTAAQTEYAKRISDMLYNEESGLMNRQLKAADGVSLAYQDGEKKIRQDIMKQYRLAGKGLQAFNAMCDRDDAGHWGRINQYEFNEGQKNKKIVTDNALVQIGNEAQALYNDVSMMNDALGKMKATIDANYFNMGKDYCDAYFRQSAANLVASSLNVAIRKNDMPGAETIMAKFGQYVPPDQLSTYAKVVQEYIKENQQIANTERLYQTYGNDIRGAFEAIDREAKVEIPVSGSIAEQAIAAAKYVEERTGIPAALVYGQWVHESSANGSPFNSRLARENMNFGGLTQTTPNGEDNKQPDGRNYYKKYNSIKEYADDYVDSFIKYYKFDPKDIKTPQDLARLLKQNGYYTDSEARYASGIASGMRGYNPAAIRSDNVSVQKQKDDYLKYYNREKKIAALQLNAKLEGAEAEFDADPINADPRAIAQKYGDLDPKATNTIATYLTNKKLKFEEKGMGLAAMDSVSRMIGAGKFESELQLLSFMQSPEHRFNTKEIIEARKEYKNWLNGKGEYAYEGLNDIIADEIAGEKPAEAKSRAMFLRRFARDFIREYTSDPKNKGRQPTPEELRKALSKDVTETKMTAQDFDNMRYTYDQRLLTANGIVSAQEIYPGMMKVKYRDYNTDYRGKEVIIPTKQFVKDIGLEGSRQIQLLSNPWFQDVDYNDISSGS